MDLLNNILIMAGLLSGSIVLLILTVFYYLRASQKD
jgi:hypothetical protein